MKVFYIWTPKKVEEVSRENMRLHQNQISLEETEAAELKMVEPKAFI